MGESEKYIGEGRLCERCIRKCANADCEKDYCENFCNEEEFAHIANAEIEAIRKRCYEKFMREVYAYVLSVQQKIDIIEKKLKK